MDKETQRLLEETPMLLLWKVCFTSTQEFPLYAISLLSYSGVIIFLLPQQTRGPIQRHSRNLVHQTIAMVKFYSLKKKKLLSISGP
jgi:hypothetical protein